MNVFIIGSKGIPARYGGFETFVEQLIKNQISSQVKYYVSCIDLDKVELEYSRAICFKVDVPNIGPAKAVLYDILSIRKCFQYIKKYNLQNCIIYILTCRIGPFIPIFNKLLKQSNVKIYVNPDGHEWKRSKWNYLIKLYWRLSEKLTIKHSHLVICDSIAIEKYIRETYVNYTPQTVYISYGAYLTQTDNDDINKYNSWISKNNINKCNYYLIVGRFVPENNYEYIIEEFMKTTTQKDLVIVTNANFKLFAQLKSKLKFHNDPRVKFVGSIYDQCLLRKVREYSYAYIHGHEVGGTNPSLLEALATTNINLLLDVVFNKEVGGNGALYFSKENNSLYELLSNVDVLSKEEISILSKKAKERIRENYTWDYVVKKYESTFLYQEMD